MIKFIAHYRKSDDEKQYVYQHLAGVALLTENNAAKMGLADAGRLLGFLHDLGKYSQDFQNYIQSATDILNPDRDDSWVDATSLKGKIDHSTAGAQWVWLQFKKYGDQGKLVGQILSVCLASHHGGMLNCLELNGDNGFLKRIKKQDAATHLKECYEVCDKKIKKQLEELATVDFLKDFLTKLSSIYGQHHKEPLRLKAFRLGFLTRFLFSCLIDADRVDSADFEIPDNQNLRRTGQVDWQIPIDRLEAALSKFEVRNEVDKIRNQISAQCLARSSDHQGIYTLTVPTGGGKTFTSIRYGLHHAKKHKLDHIYYIIPYTSIIEQNAQVVREILEHSDDTHPWVLEHHSNLEPETQTWHAKLFSENWDAPIIFTTMVQFLEVLFGGGTRGARRMHNLANSLIIFDEIQSLPINCVHLLNNGLQFLVNYCKTTALLCTATQPLLGEVNQEYGALDIPKGNELVTDAKKLFAELKRVEIVDKIKPNGWTAEEITELACHEYRENGNCLVIVNTKAWARTLYELCSQEMGVANVFHLSTSLCPAHRKIILDEVTSRLENQEPVLCVSTQLIEAGVDIDFNVVIRFLAGLDSIAQAAGRCNRNGTFSLSKVFVVNPNEETIASLDDIRVGQETAQRVLGESEHADFLSPSAIERYFSYFFYERQQENPNPMLYPLDEKQVGQVDTLLNLLCDNPLNIGREQNPNIITLQQSFKSAGKTFKAINAPTQAVIVQFGEGKKIIADLCADFEPSKAYNLLKKAQQYSVNVFPKVWKKLLEAGAVHQIQQGQEIYYLDKRYYSKEFGVSTKVVEDMEFLSA